MIRPALPWPGPLSQPVAGPGSAFAARPQRASLTFCGVPNSREHLVGKPEELIERLLGVLRASGEDGAKSRAAAVIACGYVSGFAESFADPILLAGAGKPAPHLARADCVESLSVMMRSLVQWGVREEFLVRATRDAVAGHLRTWAPRAADRIGDEVIREWQLRGQAHLRPSAWHASGLPPRPTPLPDRPWSRPSTPGSV